jgi:hypothetical protein
MHGTTSAPARPDHPNWLAYKRERAETRVRLQHQADRLSRAIREPSRWVTPSEVTDDMAERGWIALSVASKI